MSTPNTVKAQLQNLIDFSNRKTGKSDTDLTGAVNTLVNERDSLIDGSITEFYSELEEISEYAFARRRNLINVYLPNILIINSAAFYNASGLKNIIAPKLRQLLSSSFNGCTSLEYIDLGLCDSIGTSSFTGCSLLSCVVFRKVIGTCNLSSTNPFDNTMIASGTGYIYVPKTQIENYKVATNWTIYASQFRALEDYTVDGTIDGELDWDKVNGGAA